MKYSKRMRVPYLRRYLRSRDGMIYDIIYAAQSFTSDSVLLSGSVLLFEERAVRAYLGCLV